MLFTCDSLAIMYRSLKPADFSIDYPRRNCESAPEVIFPRQSSAKINT